VGSYLDPSLTPQPIGAISGGDLGAPALGPMSDWCATIVTPSKTFALPTSRVAFVTTTNERLRAAMGHYRTVHSFGRVPQAGELTGAAAMALTPQTWVDEWNDRCRAKLAWLTHEVARINRKLGFEAYRVDVPEGGWYACLRVSQQLFPPGAVATSFEAFAVLLAMGIGLLPGELFGYGLAGHTAGMFTLRGNIGVSDGDLTQLVSWLREAALLLVGDDGPRITQHALTSARKVVDIDTIMQQRRY
jgi:bifunctional pyridoxal-dependent enzyme with beta-cystathionase and maltose regulon repressor activities